MILIVQYLIVELNGNVAAMLSPHVIYVSYEDNVTIRAKLGLCCSKNTGCDLSNSYYCINNVSLHRLR